MTASPLKIDSAELRLVRLPLLSPFTIATGTMHEKLFPLLTLRANGIEGYAEGVMDPLPDYLDETIAGAMMLLRDVLMPQLVGRSFESPAAIGKLLHHWRGHYMTKAMVEMAFWDLWAKSLNLPLKTLLGGEQRRDRRRRVAGHRAHRRHHRAGAEAPRPRLQAHQAEDHARP